MDSVRVDDHAPTAAEVGRRDLDLPIVACPNDQVRKVGEVISLLSTTDGVQVDLVGAWWKMRERDFS